MTTAAQIAEFYGLDASGESFVGECPSCGYRGFSVTEKDGRTLFYCNAGGCAQEEVISNLREAGLWEQSPSEVFTPLDNQAPRTDQHRRKAKSIRAALAMWRRSQPATGTVVETYLRARDYRGLIPPDLRYVTAKHRSDSAMHPVMLGAVTRTGDPDQITGVHRTFLRSDGSAKADLPEKKMSLGGIRGAAVRLTPAASKLAICEGIETGLSFMQATGIPTWAALSAAGMQSLLLPPEVREVVIAADPDPVGIKTARRAAYRWHGEGRTVRIVQPPQGFDFNDLARAP
jgi:putative DNA primase/helicase